MDLIERGTKKVKGYLHPLPPNTKCVNKSNISSCKDKIKLKCFNTVEETLTTDIAFETNIVQEELNTWFKLFSTVLY